MADVLEATSPVTKLSHKQKEKIDAECKAAWTRVGNYSSEERAAADTVEPLIPQRGRRWWRDCSPSDVKKYSHFDEDGVEWAITIEHRIVCMDASCLCSHWTINWSLVGSKNEEPRRSLYSDWLDSFETARRVAAAILSKKQ